MSAMRNSARPISSAWPPISSKRPATRARMPSVSTNSPSSVSSMWSAMFATPTFSASVAAALPQVFCFFWRSFFRDFS